MTSVSPEQFMEFAKAAGPAALGALVVVYLIVKFIPDLMASHKEAIASQGQLYKESLDKVVAGGERQVDRLEAAIKENGRLDRESREKEGALGRKATEDLTVQVREAMRSRRRESEPQV